MFVATGCVDLVPVEDCTTEAIIRGWWGLRNPPSTFLVGVLSEGWQRIVCMSHGDAMDYKRKRMGMVEFEPCRKCFFV